MKHLLNYLEGAIDSIINKVKKFTQRILGLGKKTDA